MIRSFIAGSLALLLLGQYAQPAAAAQRVPASDTVAAAENSDWLYDNNRRMTEQWVNPGSYAGPIDSAYLTELSNEITAGLDDDLEKVQAIHDWVAANIYYDYDQYDEPLNAISYTESDQEKLTAAGFGSILSEDFLPSSSAAEDTTVLQRGVCRGYSVLTRDLVRAQGIPCIYISGYADHDLSQDKLRATYAHAWNAAFVEGRWVYMDTTWDSSNQYRDGVYHEGGAVQRQYFDISLEELSKDHYFSEFGDTGAGDIPSEWAKDGVWSAIVSGYVPNSLQQSYRSDITRQQFCAILYQFLQAQDPKALADAGASLSPFTDIDDQAVTAVYQLGIVSGVGGGRFAPSQAITRQEAATMLSRLTQMLGISSVQSGQDFSDQAQIADWARQAVNQVTGLGIMEGTGTGFGPLGSYTIEQAITTIQRIGELL